MMCSRSRFFTVAVGAPGHGRLADPADVFGAARVLLAELPPRVAVTMNPKQPDADRTQTPCFVLTDDGMEKSKIIPRRGYAPWTIQAIDGLGLARLLLRWWDPLPMQFAEV